ncbi:MAG: hypothetical protein OWU33_14585 [Firmicutes bacterium]|nr:hypothetical protein [Bacillota bacterium]
MSSVTESLNEAAWDWIHVKTAAIAGIGYFTDAYDLFVIGAALALIRSQWHLQPFMTGLLGSVALAAACLGAWIFGRAGDLWGRRGSTVWRRFSWRSERFCPPWPGILAH